MSISTKWYQSLRDAHRPHIVRVLLIGESAPDPLSEQKRFFYAPILDRRDNLFRGVVEALYGNSPARAGDRKKPWLERLQSDGVFLIDLVPYPVNRLPRRERAKALRDHAAACVDVVRAIRPEAIIVCHKPTFETLVRPLRNAQLPLVHEHAIPFPLANWRPRFVSCYGARLMMEKATA